MTAIAPSDQRWIFGPIPDLLIGCGLGYALLIAVIPLLPFDVTTFAIVGMYGSLVIGAPHYGATLLRVYRHREDRRKYAFFSVYLSAIVWLWFAFGLYDIRLGSAMITLYLTWSPYHYTGQNYGLAVMFLRRRGVPFDLRTKRLLYASFMLSFALAFVSLHRGLGQVSYGVGDFKGTPFYFIHFGIPLEVWSMLFTGVLGAYVLVTAVAFARLLRTSTVVDLIPVASLTVAQALWFTLPYTYSWWTNTSISEQGAGWLFVWAILGHSAQYLWITTYYAIGRKGGRKRWTYLAATLGAGSAIWTVPALIFSPQLFGTHPYSMGLLLMIAAAVNLQHFILDGAIWKLRDTGVGSILLAPARPESSETAARPLPGWLSPIGWSLAALLTVLSLYGAAEEQIWKGALQAGDYDAAEDSGKRLTRILRADPRMLIAEGDEAIQAGDREGGLEAYRRSIAFYPTSQAYLAAAITHIRGGEREIGLEALQASLEIDERNAIAHRVMGAQLLESGQLQPAVRHLEWAALLAPYDPHIRRELEQARAMRDQREAQPTIPVDRSPSS